MCRDPETMLDSDAVSLVVKRSSRRAQFRLAHLSGVQPVCSGYLAVALVPRPHPFHGAAGGRSRVNVTVVVHPPSCAGSGCRGVLLC